MRYRPFPRTSMALSSLSLSLDGAGVERSSAEWCDLLHAAFEEGVNTFEIVHPTPELLHGIAEGAASVQRRLLFFALRVDAAHDHDRLTRAVEDVLRLSGLGKLDLVSLDAAPGMTPGPPPALRAMRDSGLAGRIGVAGEYDVLAPQFDAGGYDAVITSFNILSGWRERHLVRRAMELQVAVVGRDPYPARAADLVKTDVEQTKGGWFSKAPPLAGAGSYAFLSQTLGWSAEQICLGYALTEPSLATVQMRSTDRSHLADLAEVTERDLPPAVSAQIEMARFSAERDSGVERRRVRRSA
jgi:aryl-alcohol dehydrogenase-like predicted oxidoreductase